MQGPVGKIDPVQIGQTAEEYYRSGQFYCSEAIVKTINDTFGLGYPDRVVRMASGFPIGIGGAGCACGAVTGGVMAIGMVFGRERPGDPSELTGASVLPGNCTTFLPAGTAVSAAVP